MRAQLQYRFAFVMRIVGLITSYTGTAVTMWIMLYQFQELGSWTFYEMLFLLQSLFLSWGSASFSFSTSGGGHHILNGTFDRFLVRPIIHFFISWPMNLMLAHLDSSFSASHFYLGQL
ncbi:ABC-2 family transporter protein [Cytobacillus firmus]|uniref:ABC-2 family transporter protein n=1 Tax=Cytobacillus firmus TaxID=1399 RepID=UPI001FD55313|nr:ABC-2 family transporter protein [Cytobacillus firmus]